MGLCPNEWSYASAQCVPHPATIMQHEICITSIVPSYTHSMYVLHTHVRIPIFPCFSWIFLTPGLNSDTYCMPKESEVLLDGTTRWDMLNIAMDTSDTKKSTFPWKRSTSQYYQQKSRKVSVFSRSVKKKVVNFLPNQLHQPKGIVFKFYFRNLFEIIIWPLSPCSACVGSTMEYIGQPNARRQTVMNS